MTPTDSAEATDGRLPARACPASFELDDGWQKRLAEYRREHFAVEASPSRHGDGEINLSLTTNGNQWQTIGLMPEEIQIVIDALIPFLPNV